MPRIALCTKLCSAEPKKQYNEVNRLCLVVGVCLQLATWFTTVFLQREIFHTNLNCWAVPNLISSSYFHNLLRLPSVSVSNHPPRGKKGGLGQRESRKQIEVRRVRSKDMNREKKGRNKHNYRLVYVCSQFRMLPSGHLIVGLLYDFEAWNSSKQHRTT